MKRSFFLNGEYLIYRTLPRSPEPYIEAASFNFPPMKRMCENLNQGSDYGHYVLRQFFQGRLHKVDEDGFRTEVSLQQCWKVEEHYLNKHFDHTNSGRILNCKCSYPYFAAEIANPDDSLSSEQAAQVNSADYAVTQPVTCLVEDKGRSIENCPNCNRNIYWEGKAFNQPLSTPQAPTPRNNQSIEEDDYVVIQTNSSNWRLRWVFKTNNHSKALGRMSIENMASDRDTFGIRICYNNKLYEVCFDGNPTRVSLEQDWQVHQSYLREHRNPENDGEIITCSCSYPFFTYLASESSTGHVWAESQPMTCLVDDNNRNINNCPNCGNLLFAEEEDLDDDRFDVFYPANNSSVPATCEGCKNYHGKYYGNNLLVCGIHPSGFDGNSCPDYIS